MPGPDIKAATRLGESPGPQEHLIQAVCSRVWVEAWILKLVWNSCWTYYHHMY